MNDTAPRNTEAGSSTRQRAILVLGAGRSGTSTLTRALLSMGVYLGSKFRVRMRKNPRGSFEEVHLLRLSKAVRRELGLRPENVRLIEDAEWQAPGIEKLKDRMSRVIERELGGYPVWGFKYGSNGRILPFWLDLLPRMHIEPSFAFAYRNPLSVARSREKLDRYRGRLEHNNLEWLVNVVPYFRRLRDYPLAVVDYDRLMSRPADQLHRLAGQLQLPIGAETKAGIDAFAGEFLTHDLRHTQFTDDDLEQDDRLHPLVRRAALLLSALARDEVTVEDPGLWQEWHAIETELWSLAPLLRLIDYLQKDLRRARWWDVATPLRKGWNAMPLIGLRR